MREDELRLPARGFGMLAGDDGLRLLGTLFSSSMFLGRAPAGHALLASFVGGARRPELVDLPDGELVDLCRRDLERAMCLSGTPVFARVFRHRVGIPQIAVGHAERLARIEAEIARWPTLALAGAGLRGVSAEAAAQSGLAAAERLLSL